MSATSFAIWASGVGLALCWGALAANAVTPIESPELLIALFLGIFVAFGAAVWTHPKREIDGTSVNVDWSDVIKTAPLWSTVLVVLSMAAMIAAWAAMPAGETRFSITRAALVGRPDRVTVCLTFSAAFYAFSLHTALSARALRAKMGLPWLPP